MHLDKICSIDNLEYLKILEGKYDPNIVCFRMARRGVEDICLYLSRFSREDVIWGLCYGGHVNILLKHFREDISRMVSSVMYISVRVGSEDMIEYILDNIPLSSDLMNDMMEEAIINNRHGIVQTLISKTSSHIRYFYIALKLERDEIYPIFSSIVSIDDIIKYSYEELGLGVELYRISGDVIGVSVDCIKRFLQIHLLILLATKIIDNTYYKKINIYLDDYGDNIEDNINDVIEKFDLPDRLAPALRCIYKYGRLY